MEQQVQKGVMFDWETNEPVEAPSDLDHRSTEECDACRERKQGTMFHAAGATGRVCPVLFLCDDCSRT